VQRHATTARSSPAAVSRVACAMTLVIDSVLPLVSGDGGRS
jgi:hypothetical protein